MKRTDQSLLPEWLIRNQPLQNQLLPRLELPQGKVQVVLRLRMRILDKVLVRKKLKLRCKKCLKES